MPPTEPRYADLPGHTLRAHGGNVLSALRAAPAVRYREVLAPARCESLARGVYSGRHDWYENFGGAQFTLGAAWYVHLEEARERAYFAGAAASDASVRRHAPGLQETLLELLGLLARAPVVQRPGWCGPGVHVFPAGGEVSESGGEVHYDTEGFTPAQLERRAPAFTAVLMLQPPRDGGGLRVWEALYDGDDETPRPEALAAPSVVVPYRAGDLVVIDSYRLHQICPFGGELDRISATAHAVLEGDVWQAWF